MCECDEPQEPKEPVQPDADQTAPRGSSFGDLTELVLFECFG